MMVLVSYDVCVTHDDGTKRLRNVAKACSDYGQRVQFSVFECIVEPHQWVQLKARLEKIINQKTDSLRYYHLGANWKNKVEHFGARMDIDIEGPLII